MSCTARPSLADRGRAKQWLDGRLCHAGHDGGCGRSRGGNLGERLGPSLISPAYHIRQSFPLGGGLCLEGRFRERRLGPVVQSTLTHAEAITRSVSDNCEAGRRALKQVHSDADVQKVPEQAVGEGGLVRAGEIKITPEPHPPSAIPKSVAMMTRPTRAPASLGGKYSRTMMA